MEKKENKDYKIVKTIKNKKNSDIINLPLALRQNTLSITKNKQIIEAPITAYRILFKILNNISNTQFNPKKQPKQLSLFEDEFMTQNNTYCRFVFPVKEIDKNNSYLSIEKGLEFLENLEKGWHKSRNSKGKLIKSLGGLISNSVISDGKICFFISNYWMEQLTKLPAYNQAIFQLPWELTNPKHLLLYLWLLEVPTEGTKINIDEFQKAYKYNYSSNKDLSKNVFKVLKEKLAVKANISFNYTFIGHLIHIKPYKSTAIDIDIKDNTITKLEITQKLYYWKSRHKLDKNHILIFRSMINIDPLAFNLFKSSYDILVKECKARKQKITDFIEDDFMNVFQEKIKREYQESLWNNINPNGFPKIT